MGIMNWLTDNSGLIVTTGFFTAFVTIALWAYMPSNKHTMQEQAMIPFKEQTHD